MAGSELADTMIAAPPISDMAIWGAAVGTFEASLMNVTQGAPIAHRNLRVSIAC